MKIIEFYKCGPVFSFEFFVPKTAEDLKDFGATLKEIRTLNPHFVTLTYGAAGSAKEKTLTTLKIIRQEFGFETVAHLTCMTHTRFEIERLVAQIKGLAIENIMALRGDPPQEGSPLLLDKRDYKYARDLVLHLKTLGDFCISVAGYPEGHPECPSKVEDLKHLKEKVAAGAQLVVTQLFFKNEDYFDFVERARALDITCPIVPGIMPITNFQQIKRFSAICGTSLPQRIVDALEPIKDDKEAVTRYGIKYAMRQCEELLERGAPGIHFYTLNRSYATRIILSQLKELTDKKLGRA